MPPKLARPPKKGTKADLEAKAKKVRKDKYYIPSPFFCRLFTSDVLINENAG